MASYTLKSFDEQGRLVGRFEFIAASDDEAQAAAGGVADHATRELWRGRRWVSTWPGSGVTRRAGRAEQPRR